MKPLATHPRRRPSSSHGASLLALLVLLLPAAAHSQVSPLGPAFRVNDYTTATQWRPQVASAGNGDFVIAWESLFQDGDDAGIVAKASFHHNEIQVNTTTVGAQKMPAISQAANDEFVVVWDGPYNTVPPRSAIYARRYDAAGNPASSQIVVQSSLEAVGGAHVSHGFNSWVAAWGEVNDQGSVEVFARQYDSNGTPFDDPFQVNAPSSIHHRLPRVSHTSTGDYAIAWHRGPSTEDGPVAFTCYDLVGNQICPQRTVVQGGPPDVSHGLNDDFYVVLDVTFGSSRDIRLLRYNSVYEGQGSLVPLNSDLAGEQTRPRIDHDQDGDFAVVWQSDGRIVGRCFTPPATPNGVDFEISATGRYPEVAFYEDDHFIVTWDEGGSGDIWAREFVILPPASVGDPGPEGVSLSVSARPTVFREAVDLRFRLPDSAPLSARILDLGGRVVRTLLDRATLGAGEHTVVWDGRDALGARAAAGVYFYEVFTDRARDTGKLARLR